MFERLDDENIRVAESLRYYPYRATFDFECWFDTEHLPSDNDQVHWVARHVPLSVSVASNVPGHEQVTCLVTDGDNNKLVSAMMTILQSMSEAAYEKIKDSYENVLKQLAEELTKWDEREEAARSATDKDSRPATNPYKTLMGQLYGWMRQLPVIGFNSGKYDLNAIKQFLIPYFLTTAKTEEQDDEDEEEEEREQEEKKKEENDGVGSMFVIKRNNTFMCLSTDQLKFLDMINYIAPGFSYDKYLKAYGCEVTKGHFPYEYMDRLERLDDIALPPKEAFFSRLKNEGISDEDYASCQEAWRANGMTTLCDFLVWYNNRDVVPFLQATDRQFAFYRQRGIDMFKQGISVPGLTLLYLFNDLPEKTYFTIFNEKNKDLHKILLATPLLRWYLDHGLEVLHVYQVIEYDPIPCFRRFGDAVSKARREGDVHQDKIIIADTMKLLGNSSYGKTITNVDRHCDVSYCTEKAASLMVNDKLFRQLEIVVDDAYEIEMNKKTVKYTLPVHVGFFVLQYAKMRMLQFYYDFIIRYVERPLFQYCEMDTYIAYLALAGESDDDLLTPALRDHYFRHRSEWLPSECCDEHRNDYVRCRLANRPWVGDEACCKARRAFDKRTPGLFKVEWSGDGFVGLCSKTYYCFGATDKYSTK